MNTDTSDLITILDNLLLAQNYIKYYQDLFLKGICNLEDNRSIEYSTKREIIWLTMVLMKDRL